MKKRVCKNGITLPNYPRFNKLLKKAKDFPIENKLKAEFLFRLSQLDFFIKKVEYYENKIISHKNNSTGQEVCISLVTMRTNNKQMNALRTYAECFYVMAARICEILEANFKGINSSEVSIIRAHLIVHSNTKAKHNYAVWSFNWSSECGPALNQVSYVKADKKHVGPTRDDEGLAVNSRTFFNLVDKILSTEQDS